MMQQISITGDGRRTEIKIDGQSIDCVTELTLKMNATDLPELDLKLLGHPHIETLAELNVSDEVTDLLERVLATLHNNNLAGVIDLNKLIMAVKSKVPSKTGFGDGT